MHGQKRRQIGGLLAKLPPFFKDLYAEDLADLMARAPAK